MLIKFYGPLAEYADLELEKTNFKELLSLMRLHYGNEFFDTLINTPFIYFLTSATGETFILTEEVIQSDLSTFDVLHIIPEVTGDLPVIPALVIALGSIGFTASAAALTLAVVGNVLIALAVAGMAMMVLSPTPEFSTDPAAKQKNGGNNLFSSAPIIREQGGSVPLVFGNAYCGGVLISSGIFTEQT